MRNPKNYLKLLQFLIYLLKIYFKKIKRLNFCRHLRSIRPVQRMRSAYVQALNRFAHVVACHDSASYKGTSSVPPISVQAWKPRPGMCKERNVLYGKYYIITLWIFDTFTCKTPAGTFFFILTAIHPGFISNFFVFFLNKNEAKKALYININLLTASRSATVTVRSAIKARAKNFPRFNAKGKQ